MATNPFIVTLTNGADTYSSRGFDFDIPLTIYALAGNDSLDVTGGWQTICYMGDGDDVVRITGGTYVHVYGEAGNDRVDMYAAALLFNGGSGNDVVNVYGGTFLTADGGVGSDRVNFFGDLAVNVAGGESDDRFYGNGHAFSGTILGGAGNDQFLGFRSALGGDLTLSGGAGDDVYRLDTTAVAVVETADGGIDSVTASLTFTLGANVENLTLTGAAAINGGGNGIANIIVGNAAANRLYGQDGADRLYGNGGNDMLDGGLGADRLYGGTGDDLFLVDAGSDVVIESAGQGIDQVRASAGFTLGVNVDNLTLTGSAAINGGGNAIANQITGNGAANILSGAGGDDILSGLAGGDTLNGGDGADSLRGGGGRDRHSGGTGADTFVFDDGEFGATTALGADVIHDFEDVGGDRLSLSLVDANVGLAGDQAFAFLGTAAFTGVAGQLRFEQSGGNTYVRGDVNGDAIADFWIRLDGLHTLNTGDFIL